MSDDEWRKEFDSLRQATVDRAAIALAPDYPQVHKWHEEFIEATRLNID